MRLARFALVIASLLVTDTRAHDSWISRGGLRNAAGEWCCGEGDCGLVLDPANAISIIAGGYHVHGAVKIAGAGEGGDVLQTIDEIVPFAETQPSPDGAYWRCKRPDGSRRCFFAPPPNT
jgi:hypothetical protein